MFGALIGAISWNFLTWYHGIPSSLSHALIGGIVGAVLAKAGFGVQIAGNLWKTTAFIRDCPLAPRLLS